MSMSFASRLSSKYSIEKSHPTIKHQFTRRTEEMLKSFFPSTIDSLSKNIQVAYDQTLDHFSLGETLYSSESKSGSECTSNNSKSNNDMNVLRKTVSGVVSLSEGTNVKTADLETKESFFGGVKSFVSSTVKTVEITKNKAKKSLGVSYLQNKFSEFKTKIGNHAVFNNRVAKSTGKVLSFLFKLPEKITKTVLTAGLLKAKESWDISCETAEYSKKNTEELTEICDNLILSKIEIEKSDSSCKKKVSNIVNAVTAKTEEQRTASKNNLKAIIRSEMGDQLVESEVDKQVDKLIDNYKSMPDSVNENKLDFKSKQKEIKSQIELKNEKYEKTTDQVSKSLLLKDINSLESDLGIIDDVLKEETKLGKLKDELAGFNDLQQEYKNQLNTSNKKSVKNEILNNIKTLDLYIHNKNQEITKQSSILVNKYENYEDENFDHMAVLQKLKNNDTEGTFVDLFNEASNIKSNLTKVSDELLIADELKNMDSTERTSYRIDNDLDFIDDAANSMWSIGLSAGMLFPPALGVSLIGGGLVSLAKGAKILNNSLRGMYAKAKETSNLKEGKSLAEEIKLLKDSVGGVKAGTKKVVDYISDINELVKKSGLITNKDEKREYLRSNLEVLFKDNDGIKSDLIKLGELMGELKNKVVSATKHRKAKEQATREAMFDAVNFVTWAILITAAGAGVQAQMDGDSSFEAGVEGVLNDPRSIVAPGADPVNQMDQNNFTLFPGADDQVSAGGGVSWAVNKGALNLDIEISNGLSDWSHSQDNLVLAEIADNMGRFKGAIDVISDAGLLEVGSQSGDVTSVNNSVGS